MSNTDGGQSPSPNSGISQLVTVNQQGVIAINALAQVLTALIAKFPDWVPVPATATSSGAPGQVAYADSFFYVCVEPNVWVRAALSTF